MNGLALLLLQAATAPVAQPDVVVTAATLSGYKEALSRCVQRRCPPKEEIADALAYAEAQLLAGDYQGSRATLLRARHRNARYAAELPIEASGLHLANVRLADLNGLPDAGRIGTFDVVDALKAGLPDDDARVMAARLLVGDEFAKAGRLDGALRHYRWVEKSARGAHMPLVVGMAKFRRATLLAVVASVDRSYRSAARRAAAEILESTDPDWATFRNGVRLAPVFLAPEERRAPLVEAAITSLEPQPGELVQPIYQPPIDTSGVEYGAAAGDARTRWADVAFRIAPDGRVADVMIVRRSERLVDEWLAPALAALRERRYVPLKLPPGSAGVERLERYSIVSDLVPTETSRIPVRSSARRIAIMDISERAMASVGERSDAATGVDPPRR